MIRNACEFALEGDASLSFEEEKLLRSVQEQIEDLFPIQQEPEQELEREQGWDWSKNRSRSRNKRRGRKRNRNSVLAWR